jgi:DNA repair exonuclease SbcCD ATPase subunit
MKKLLVVGAVAAALAGCATAPQRSEQVEQARAEIQTLTQDPLAQQSAGRDLEAARKSLQDAELALQQKRPPAVVDHYAYLAKRHAEAGEARVSEAHSRQEVARAEGDRNKILMESRNREAMNSQAQADSAKNQAAAAQAQLANAQQQLADLQAKQTDRGVVVTLGDVLFDTGQAVLRLARCRRWVAARRIRLPAMTLRKVASRTAVLRSYSAMLRDASPRVRLQLSAEASQRVLPQRAGDWTLQPPARAWDVENRIRAVSGRAVSGGGAGR